MAWIDIRSNFKKFFIVLVIIALLSVTSLSVWSNHLLIRSSSLDVLYPHDNGSTNALLSTLEGTLNVTTTTTLKVTIPKKISTPTPLEVTTKVAVEEHRLKNVRASSKLKDVENLTANARVKLGGSYSPENGGSHGRLAILVPYRNRELQLPIFLAHMHNILQLQRQDYTIFIVELALPATFNRGLLANAGFVAANKLGNYTCFIVHDVDLLMSDDRNIYHCSYNNARFRHLSVAVSKLNYRLPYSSLVGGVTAITKTQFEKINGFSNLYFGWGGEDDDVYNRLNKHGYSVERPSVQVGRYEALPHARDAENNASQKRFTYLNRWKQRCEKDGLVSLNNITNFTVELRPMYTWVNVTADENTALKAFPV